MAMIRITPFSGMIPRMGSRLLPNEAARSASNVKLQSGELRPLRNPALTYTPASPKTNPASSIFKARSGTLSSAWFSWPTDVDCVRVPLSTDVESRFCWTGDGQPKMATYTNAVSGGADNYPLAANELALGIPAPQTAPTVSPSGGVGSAATRFYCYTFYSALGEESAPSPISAETVGKVDDTWALSAIDVVPPNSGDITALTYTGKSVTITTTNLHYNRVGESVTIAGVTTVTNVNGTWVLTAINAASKTMTFTVTSNPTGAYNNATDTTDTWTRKVPWNTSGMIKRVYRTTGASGTWELLDATGVAAATTTYNDTITDINLAGDELITDGWLPPPVGLTGLCVHPSGSLLGFVGNLLCASEPYQPHAWPEVYQLASGYNGVGLAVFGTTAVMATAGMPFVATGVDPASMSGEDVQGMYPCLSKRSVISVGDGVLYSSRHGAVYVGASGVRIFTDTWYTLDEWETLNPETMIFATANGRVYVAYTADDGVGAMLIFDGSAVIGVSMPVTELYADVSSGELYITNSTGILLWDSASKTPLQGNWRSKEFVFPKPINIGAGKIDFDLAANPTAIAALTAAIAAIEAANAALFPSPASGPLTAPMSDAIGGGYGDDDYGEIHINGSAITIPPDNPASNQVTVTLYSGDEIIASRVITSELVFRLPAGYKKDHFSVEVTSQCAVKEIRLAETPKELAQA